MKTSFEKFDGIESVPAGACFYYWRCGNTTAAGKDNAAELCDECIDWVRSGGRGHSIPEQLSYDENNSQ